MELPNILPYHYSTSGMPCITQAWTFFLTSRSHLSAYQLFIILYCAWPRFVACLIWFYHAVSSSSFMLVFGMQWLWSLSSCQAWTTITCIKQIALLRPYSQAQAKTNKLGKGASRKINAWSEASNARYSYVST